MLRRRIVEVGDGLAYCRTKSVLFAAALLDLIAMVFGMPRALYPQIAEGISGSDRGLSVGLLYAAIPLGGVLTGLLSRLYVGSPRQGLLLMRSVLLWGAAITAFGLSHSLILDFFILTVAGSADMIGMVMRSSILQTETSDDMQGRVSGVAIVFAAGGPRLADFFHGFVASLGGTGWAVSGGGMLVVLGVLALMRPAKKLVAYRVDARPLKSA
jgi:MFS family permease